MRSTHVAFGRMPTPRPAVAAAAWWAVVVLGGMAAAAAPPMPVRSAGPAALPRPVVDRAVVPAGGGACRHCPSGACPIHGGHQGHLDGCRDGLCAPHCPVRPAEYGFYRTQWRRWPGQGVVPVSAEQEATPVSPPRSLAPSADQESPMSPEDAAPPSEPAADGRDADRAAPDEAPPGSKPAAPPQKESGAATPSPARDAAVAAKDDRPVDASAEAAPLPKTASVATLGEADAAPPITAGLTTAEPAGLRYPTAVGRSLAAGVPPWRLHPEARQRPASAARGL